MKNYEQIYFQHDLVKLCQHIDFSDNASNIMCQKRTVLRHNSMNSYEIIF
jgi:hypothetical protein